MLLIAIDTSGSNGSVALCRAEHDSFEVLQLRKLERGTYSARLMPAIAAMLAQQQIHKEQIDTFVVVSGPGSFTGLRVGLATVKGLCEVLQKPLVALTMLEAVAAARMSRAALEGDGFKRADNPPSDSAASAEGAAVALDAGRGEVYVGDFVVDGAQATCQREYIAKLEKFAAEAVSTGTLVLTPDAKVADSLNDATVSVRLVAPIQADEIALIGLGKFLRGETSDPATLDATYIRRSDAEIFSAPQR
jgi:tRNA threonylcarbamoyladenosine biosynthesis protein TsaB